MTCEEARESFSDLSDGRLAGPALAGLDQHLGGCPGCRAEWDAFLKAIQAVADLGAAEPSPGFAARVREQIEAPPWWQRAAEVLFFPLRVKIPIQAVAAVAVAFIAVVVYRQSPEMQREAPYGVASQAAKETTSKKGPADGAPHGNVVQTPQSALEKASEDKLDVDRPTDSLGLRGSPKHQAAPGGPGARPSGPAPATERDRTEAEPAQGQVAGRPAETPPALSDRRRLRATPETQPAAPLQGAAPAPAQVPRAPSPLREEAIEAGKKLGKTAVPAEAEEGVDEHSRRGAKDAERKEADLRLQQSGPGTAGRAAAPVPAPPPAAGSAPARPDAAPKAKQEVRRQFIEGQMATAPSTSADELYSTGLTEYARQAYDRASETFRAFLAQYPKDARAPDARYWLADSYFQQQRYAEAIPEYEVVIRQFPESRRAPAALFRQGQARLALGDQAGCQSLREFLARAPRTREAAQAREALAARCP